MDIRPFIEHAKVRALAKTAGIQTILPANYGVTGVRQDTGGNVVITGGTGPRH